MLIDELPFGTKVLYDFLATTPFNSIDGLGDTVANKIVEERNKQTFLSIEDVSSRAKVSKTLIEKMTEMGIFDGMPESNQLSLF